MGNSEDFMFAAEVATKLPSSTTDKDKLKLYGLYKQATTGDVTTCAPSTPAVPRRTGLNADCACNVDPAQP